MKYVLYFIFLICSLPILGQNLVSNGSFEEYTDCPNLSLTQIMKATPWFSPRLGYSQAAVSTDFYQVCSDNMPYVNIFSGDNYQWPRTGNGYSGMAYRTPDGANYREYIEIKLNEELIAGEEYCVSFYVSLLIDCSYAIDNIGAYFTEDTLKINDIKPHFGEVYNPNGPLTTEEFLMLNPITPQVESPDGVFLGDTLNWMQVQGCFTAVGGEEYLTIGNFNDDNNTDDFFVWEPGWEGFPTPVYYLLDDVAVYQDKIEREVADAGTAQTICANDEVAIGTHNYEDYYYFWEPSEGIPAAASGIGQIGNPTVSPETTTTYQLTVKDYAFQETTSSVTITIETGPPCNLSVSESVLDALVAYNSQRQAWEIDYPKASPAIFECYSIAGELLLQKNIKQGTQYIPTAPLAGGIYMYRIRTQAHKLLQSNKVLIVN